VSVTAAVTPLPPPLKPPAVTGLPPTELQPRDRNCNEINVVTVSQGGEGNSKTFYMKKNIDLPVDIFSLYRIF
jgi:hypothetical protein